MDIEAERNEGKEDVERKSVIWDSDSPLSAHRTSARLHMKWSAKNPCNCTNLGPVCSRQAWYLGSWFELSFAYEAKWFSTWASQVKWLDERLNGGRRLGWCWWCSVYIDTRPPTRGVDLRGLTLLMRRSAWQRAKHIEKVEDASQEKRHGWKQPRCEK